MNDLRFAFRLLRRDRAFTIAACVTLAIGIGSTSTMFSIVGVPRVRGASGEPAS